MIHMPSKHDYYYYFLVLLKLRLKEKRRDLVVSGDTQIREWAVVKYSYKVTCGNAQSIEDAALYL